MHKIKNNKKALSMSMLIGLVLLMVFLLILITAYLQMGTAGAAINTSMESNMSRLGDLTGAIE